MTTLSKWLRQKLNDRHLTLQEASTLAGVGKATLSEILTKGHVPQIDTLLRLADFFEVSHLEILMAAGAITSADRHAGAPQPGQDPVDENLLEWRLLDEFRCLPREWQEGAVEQIQWMRRLAKVEKLRIIGEVPEAESQPKP